MTYKDLAGKRVLVTGAARGMGRAIARRFAEEGAHVLILGRSRTSLAPIVEELGASGTPIICDLAEQDQIVRAVKACGVIDVLINNAGIAGEESPFLDLTPSAWNEMLAINLTAPFLMSQLVAKSMVESGKDGVILHNGSIAASAADGQYTHYSVSKAGLLALMRSMAVELAPHNIRVNAVSPGYTRTDMITSLFPGDQQEFLTKAFVRAPVHRLVEVEEIANAFVFLASNQASGMTGANLVVDGGLTANLYIMETFPKS